MTERKKRSYGLDKRMISMSVTPEHDELIRSLGNGSPTNGLVALIKHYQQSGKKTIQLNVCNII